MEPVVVRAAEPRDAFAVAALHLQAEREWGQSIPPGFLDTLADAWLRDRARQTWLAEDARHNPLGAVHGTLVRKLPSPRRATTAWMHVGFLFVTPTARGEGLGERLLRTALTWCEEQGVDRVQLHAVAPARTLYERLGFGPPSEDLVELRLSRSPRTAR
ncbi:MAG TPA: GNAT family N-acetyltransferase [Phycicoccus sp.]|jgi:GNAT superfamily N-acetyltransferase